MPELYSILSFLISFLAIIMFLFLYFLPSLIGRTRKSFELILILNVFLGWFGLAWFIALVWSIFGAKKTAYTQDTKQHENTIKLKEKDVKNTPWLLFLVFICAAVYLALISYLAFFIYTNRFIPIPF
ncbi:MAG: superinfection immunity protein [Nanoarchaeota archaeon]|nr:superinfection immunity protein [Nanoarchaeota archaeon]